jgi:hypothetical protein
MVRILLLCLLLASTACTPATPPLLLAQNCQAEFTSQELVAEHWLLQSTIWRIRQSALLEVGRKKIPMEGFLRLDLQRQEARLFAMNEMGVVLFDLQVTAEGEQLHRVLPQLQQVNGLAEGVAQSLRQIFLRPQPQLDDRLEQRGNSQRLWRSLPDGTLGFLFDCQGDLRETRQEEGTGDWRVIYGRYQSFGTHRLPEEIVMNDYQHSVKLSLWLRDLKEEL